jgi:hypothetical protein
MEGLSVSLYGYKNTKYTRSVCNREYFIEWIRVLSLSVIIFLSRRAHPILRGTRLPRRDIVCVGPISTHPGRPPACPGASARCKIIPHWNLPSFRPCRDVRRFRRSCRRWRNGAHRTCCPCGGRLPFLKTKFLCRRILVLVGTHHSAKRNSVERNPQTFRIP